MIQRVQTLFLLAVTLLMTSQFFSVMVYSPSEKVKYLALFPCIIFIVITTLISFFTIFLYHHRMLQIRITIFNTVLLIGYQAWLMYYFFKRPEGTAFSWTAIFPAVSAILSILAIRYIARDEALLRTAKHLRSVEKNRNKIKEK